ncbi:hypothetical protein GCM10010452_01810 [Crossiella cryophila]|uniref:Uncharacterized protein n=1 Tax=Crossiella cryophila TaxID=43355 RepID=A0A7W7CEE0_9PSEU|nr:hypothetical protein [Crossiella cryophila]
MSPPTTPLLTAEWDRKQFVTHLPHSTNPTRPAHRARLSTMDLLPDKAFSGRATGFSVQPD